MNLRRGIPLALTALRIALAPVIVALALAWPVRGLFAACLVLAFVSDILDGVIARRLGVATPGLRRLDSLADTIFYVAAVFAIGCLHPDFLRAHAVALSVLVALELARYAFDLRKFGREASYHMWSSKLWGIFLFLGCLALLALDNDGPISTMAIYVGIVADLEGLAISAVLPQWRTDVPTFFHALARADATAARGKRSAR